MAAQWRDGVERYAGPLAGAVGAAVALTGLALSDVAAFDEVSPEASAGTVAQVLADHEGRLSLGTSILMLGLFLLVWFLVHLGTRLDPTGATRTPAWVASAGGLITVTLVALVVAYVRAGVQTPLSGSDAVIAKGIVVFDWDYLRTFAPFISAHLLAAGIAIVRTSVLPRAVGWGAVVLAGLPLVLPPGLMTFVFLLWLFALSVGLLVADIRRT